MPTVGGRAPHWPLGTQWLALCQAGRRRQWQGEPEPSPARPGPPRAPRALGPSQWPFLGVRRDGSVSVAPHPRGEGSGFLYRGAFEPLSAFKGHKRSEANGVFCFQTDLDFVKNPSGAAVLMAGVSGVSGSTAADPPTHLPPALAGPAKQTGPRERTLCVHLLCAATACQALGAPSLLELPRHWNSASAKATALASTRAAASAFQAQSRAPFRGIRTTLRGGGVEQRPGKRGRWPRPAAVPGIRSRGLTLGWVWGMNADPEAEHRGAPGRGAGAEAPGPGPRGFGLQGLVTSLRILAWPLTRCATLDVRPRRSVPQFPYS